LSLPTEIVFGSFDGLVATICMTLFEFPFWKKYGLGGVAEWQINIVMVSIFIRRFKVRKAATSMAVAMHLLHGIILGMLFRLILFFSGITLTTSLALIYAIAYSTLLWIFSPYLTRNIFESHGGFSMTPTGLKTSFVAHIIYGVALGLLSS
jgi:hypothetical protein